MGERLTGSLMLCSLALLLSFDVSSSMNDAEFLWMRRGTAAALLSPEVQSSILATPTWIQVQEWADRQVVTVGWTEMKTREDISKIAGVLESAPRPSVGTSTGLGDAIIAAGLAFSAGPPCETLVLDISGDGESNTGPHPSSVMELIDPAIQINALAQTRGAELFYNSYVIRGPAAFTEVVSDPSSFKEAMQKKLIRELNMAEK